MKLRTYLPYVFWGALFGFFLARSGATSFERIRGMFLLTDFHLYGVIGGAIAVGAPGLWLLKRREASKKPKDQLPFPKRQFRLGTWAGAIVFGIGWGLSGTCPGTSLAQLGEGRYFALATVAGIFLGNYVFGILRPKFFGDSETCG